MNFEWTSFFIGLAIAPFLSLIIGALIDHFHPEQDIDVDIYNIEKKVKLAKLRHELHEYEKLNNKI